MSRAKTTTIFAGGGTVQEILDDISRDEPEPTAAAAAVEGKADAPVYVPASSGNLPTGVAGNGPDGPVAPGAVGAVPAGLTPREGADQLFGLVVTLGRLAGDEEWEPDSPGEAENVIRAMERVFEVRGTPNIPPELGLAIVLGRYVQVRTTRPKTRRWLGTLPLPRFILKHLGAPTPAAELPDQAG